MPNDAKALAARLASLRVLIVDDEHYMRKVIRTLLISIGVREIFEANDGLSGLDAIRINAPDVVLLDWEMPGLDGMGFLRLVRSPESFPYPGIPIIMLTGHGERSRVVKAMQAGINEFLLKPVSTKSLHDRLIAVLTHPRPVVRRDGYYGPAPRDARIVKAAADAAISDNVAGVVMID